MKEDFDKEVGHLSLERVIADIPLLGKRDQTLLVLKNSFGDNVTAVTLKKYFPSKYTKYFDMRGKYIEGAVVVAGDHRFYQSPKTLGILPNQEILDIYNENSENAVILTARESMPGMREGILSRIEEVGASPPVHVFTKPKGDPSGKYKGDIIGRIASQGSVEKISFYDDNLKYIDSVKKVLEEDFLSVRDKVTIYKVSTKDKPKEGLLRQESLDE